jgi:hypothetical protein
MKWFVRSMISTLLVLLAATSCTAAIQRCIDESPFCKPFLGVESPRVNSVVGSEEIRLSGRASAGTLVAGPREDQFIEDLFITQIDYRLNGGPGVALYRKNGPKLYEMPFEASVALSEGFNTIEFTVENSVEAQYHRTFRVFRTGRSDDFWFLELTNDTLFAKAPEENEAFTLSDSAFLNIWETDGVPFHGWTVTFEPERTGIAVRSSRARREYLFDFRIEPGVTPGTYEYLLRFSRDGEEETLPLTLNVLPPQGGPAPPPDGECEAFTLEPLALVVPSGEPVSAPVSVIRRGGFGGAVTLSLEGDVPPEEILGTYAFTPNPTTEDSALEFTLGGVGMGESHTFTLRGESEGASCTATFQVTRAGFRLAVDDAQASYPPGSSASVTVTFERFGFGDPVALDVGAFLAGDESHITNRVFTPNPADGDSAVLSFDIGSEASGMYAPRVIGVNLERQSEQGETAFSFTVEE